MKKYLYSLVIVCLCVSCSDIIEVPDISDDSVILIAPVDNATLNMTTVTLFWESVDDAENYRIQIAQPDFENILLLEQDSVVTENSISVQLEAGITYEWRVRAQNSEYATPYSTYSFTLE